MTGLINDALGAIDDEPHGSFAGRRCVRVLDRIRYGLR